MIKVVMALQQNQPPLLSWNNGKGHSPAVKQHTVTKNNPAFERMRPARDGT
jgi:hypothetical protein